VSPASRGSIRSRGFQRPTGFSLSPFLCQSVSLMFAVLVMAWTQRSLRLKYRVVVDLVQDVPAEKILVATVPGITEYAGDLERNLTNDEWTIRELARNGVGVEDIEFITLEDGFFGTLTEARTLRALCEERRIEKLLLVCSEYHSSRVRATFSALLKDVGVEIAFHTADEKVGRWARLFEYAKRVLYENVLIPFELWSQKRGKPGLSAEFRAGAFEFQ
jgi:hypothetical protein